MAWKECLLFNACRESCFLNILFLERDCRTESGMEEMEQGVKRERREKAGKEEIKGIPDTIELCLHRQQNWVEI